VSRSSVDPGHVAGEVTHVWGGSEHLDECHEVGGSVGERRLRHLDGSLRLVVRLFRLGNQARVGRWAVSTEIKVINVGLSSYKRIVDCAKHGVG